MTSERLASLRRRCGQPLLSVMGRIKAFILLAIFLTAFLGGLPGADAGNQPLIALFQSSPHYPPELRAQKVEGIVVVRFVVTKAGATHPVVAVLSSDPLFSAAAVEAVSRWQFKPAVVKGVPIPSFVQVPLAFSLRLKSSTALPPVSVETSALYVAVYRDWGRVLREITGKEIHPSLDPERLISATIVMTPQGSLAVTKATDEPDSVMAGEFRKSLERTLSDRKCSAAFMTYLSAVHRVKISVEDGGESLAPSLEAVGP